MSEEFGSDYITITDDEGKEYELEVLAQVEYNGAQYIGVCPADAQEDTELEVSVLKAEEEDGEQYFTAVTDENELEAVFELLLDSEEDEEEDD